MASSEKVDLQQRHKVFRISKSLVCNDTLTADNLVLSFPIFTVRKHCARHPGMYWSAYIATSLVCFSDKNHVLAEQDRVSTGIFFGKTNSTATKRNLAVTISFALCDLSTVSRANSILILTTYALLRYAFSKSLSHLMFKASDICILMYISFYTETLGLLHQPQVPSIDLQPAV